MGNFIAYLCGCSRKKIASGILLKDFSEKGFNLKEGTPLFVDVISSDICFSSKYKRHLTIGVDIEIVS